tara:strand:- start:2384 stop:2611 length:228 start_codon:yes stop_codon:yes gene_type:complete
MTKKREAQPPLDPSYVQGQTTKGVYHKTMPFKSHAQMTAAFAGSLGEIMKKKAKQWARKTPDKKSLPQRVSKKNN